MESDTYMDLERCITQTKNAHKAFHRFPELPSLFELTRKIKAYLVKSLANFQHVQNLCILYMHFVLDIMTDSLGFQLFQSWQSENDKWVCIPLTACIIYSQSMIKR